MKQEAEHITAIHEAGHIMAAALCDKLDLLEWCELYDDDVLSDRDGNTHWNFEINYLYPNGDGSFTDYQNTFKLVCIYCGGMCAEKVFFNRQRFPYRMFGGGARGDLDAIDTTFKVANLPEKVCQHLRKVCEWFVEKRYKNQQKPL